MLKSISNMWEPISPPMVPCKGTKKKKNYNTIILFELISQWITSKTHSMQNLCQTQSAPRWTMSQITKAMMVKEWPNSPSATYALDLRPMHPSRIMILVVQYKIDSRVGKARPIISGIDVRYAVQWRTYVEVKRYFAVRREQSSHPSHNRCPVEKGHNVCTSAHISTDAGRSLAEG